MQKSNSVTQTVESLKKTHYRICFSDLITWVTTPSQSATSNDILLRPDIKTINQPSCLIEEPKTSMGGHEIQSPDFSGVFAFPMELTTHERSNLTTAIKSALYIQIKITNPQKPRNHSRGRRTQSLKSNPLKLTTNCPRNSYSNQITIMLEVPEHPLNALNL